MKRADVVQRLALFLGTAVLAAGCATGAPESGPQGDDGEELHAHAGAGEVVVVTADGDRWVGPTARIQITGPLPDGRPAVAEVSIEAKNARGVMLGIHFEVDPSSLRDASPWSVELDSERPTRPGVGVLSYGTHRAPRSARSGHLSATVDGARMKGTFDVHGADEPSLARAAFEGAIEVDCLVAEDAVAPIGGSVGSGPGGSAFALRRDEKLESGFCAQFRGL